MLPMTPKKKHIISSDMSPPTGKYGSSTASSLGLWRSANSLYPPMAHLHLRHQELNPQRRHKTQTGCPSRVLPFA